MRTESPIPTALKFRCVFSLARILEINRFPIRKVSQFVNVCKRSNALLNSISLCLLTHDNQVHRYLYRQHAAENPIPYHCTYTFSHLHTPTNGCAPVHANGRTHLNNMKANIFARYRIKTHCTFAPILMPLTDT